MIIDMKYYDMTEEEVEKMLNQIFGITVEFLEDKKCITKSQSKNILEKHVVKVINSNIVTSYLKKVIWGKKKKEGTVMKILKIHE